MIGNHGTCVFVSVFLQMIPGRHLTRLGLD